MSDNPGLTIDFSGPEEREMHWIRLEQAGVPETAGITFAEAADLVDRLYNTSPCDHDGETGTGGEAADDSALPAEADFLAAATARLRIACMDDNGFWPAEVDVLRSHRDGDYGEYGEWRLASETEGVEIGDPVVMTGRKTELVDLDGETSYDLAYPFLEDLRVSGAVVVVRSVLGSTVNFARPAHGTVRISYTAIWDRVTVRVPATANEQGLYRAEPCGVIAFWHRLAAPLTLEQPEDDTTLATLRRICPRYRFRHEGDCFESIEHYRRCNCSGREAAGAWTETVSAACPDGTSAGAWLGQRRVLDGYVDCPGEEDKFSKPDFYKETCCGDPPGNLPRCKVERARYQGGAEIEGGPEQYIDSYGPTVRLTAITPEGGNCGEIIRTWRYTPGWAASGGPVLPATLIVQRGMRFTVDVDRGRPPFTWRVPGGVRYLGTANHGLAGLFETDESFTGGEIVAIDVCERESNPCLVRVPCVWRDLLASWTGGDLRHYGTAVQQRSEVLIRTGIDIFEPPDQPYTSTSLLTDEEKASLLTRYPGDSSFLRRAFSMRDYCISANKQYIAFIYNWTNWSVQEAHDGITYFCTSYFSGSDSSDYGYPHIGHRIIDDASWYEYVRTRMEDARESCENSYGSFGGTVAHDNYLLQCSNAFGVCARRRYSNQYVTGLYAYICD